MSNPRFSVAGLSEKPRVLLIGANETFAVGLTDVLQCAGLTAAWAVTGNDGLALERSFRPQVVVMDLELRDMNGAALLTRLTQMGDCGVIVLSNTNDEADRVTALKLGADDYMAKPARIRELTSRIRAVHRRFSMRAEPRMRPKPVLKVGPIRINLQHRTVTDLDGRKIVLTPTEFVALEVLANAAGTVVSRSTLCMALLGREWQQEDRAVDQLIFRLRRKLPVEEGCAALIQNIRGSGYWLRAPESVIGVGTKISVR